MKILIRSATILQPKSPFHKKKKNVLIQNGKITEIGDKKYSADRTIDAAGMFLTIGWFDLGTYVGDPGLEQKEDLNSLSRAAMDGGFTALATLPNTQPVVQTKNEVNYLTQGNTSRLVSIFPMAAVTKNTKGEELTEMIDLHHAGAVAFTDGLKPVWHTDIFMKALQYLQKFNGLLVDHAEDTWLNLHGQMHEGVVSTQLGLKGMPGIAEELPLNRNIELLAYAGGRYHAARLSTAQSVELLRQARKRKLPVTSDVTVYQPLLLDKSLEDFNTNLKVNPPLRSKADADAIIRGLKDGTIQAICSGHTPQEDECKELEFDLAEFGMINLQTFASNLVSLSSRVPMEMLIEKITTAPRNILGIPVPVIRAGEQANVCLFDPKAVWTLDESTNFSKSRNSPWLGKKLKGRAVAVFSNGKQYIR